MNQPRAPEFSVPDSPFYGNREVEEAANKRRCNLLMAWNCHIGALSDFEKIAAHVRRIDPKIKTQIIDKRRHKVTCFLRSTLRPTLVFSPVPLARFRPPRGRCITGQNLSKSEENFQLEAAGLPVPRWQIIAPDQALDVSAYGPYIVTKPNSGGRGALVKIKRTSRVRDKACGEIESDAKKSFRVEASPVMLAQKFIYTGQWPISYRVTTLFGKVLYSLKTEADHARNPLPDAEAFGRLEGSRGVSIVASSKGCAFSLNYDEEIIRLGEAAHAAFPDIPLLGVDIVREMPSGKLYILEVNAIGYILHFSSQLGTRLQREFGFSFESQFDGLNKAAHILAAKTQELAW